MPKECIRAGSSRFANCNYKKIRYRRSCAMDYLAWGEIKMKNVTHNCAQRQWHMIKWLKSYIKKDVSTNNQMMSIPLFICILCVVWEKVKKLNLNCMPGHAHIIFFFKENVGYISWTSACDKFQVWASTSRNFTSSLVSLISK